MMLKMNKRGFTLVEIMIVVAIIGLLAAIAIPNFIRARTTAQTNACIANLKQIEGAIQVWAIDTGGPDSTSPTWAQIAPTYLKVQPRCPVAGTATAYVLVAPSATPACPVVGTSTTHHL